MATAVRYYNVLVLGSYAVGKTSIESWLANDREIQQRGDIRLFDREYYDIRVQLIDGEWIIVRLWDTLEMEKTHANIPSSFMRQRDGFILVWDIKRKDTLFDVIALYDSLLTFYGDEHIPAFIVFANKAEKEMKLNSEEYISCLEWSNKHNIDCFKSSSETGDNLEEGLNRLVELMTSKDPITRNRKKKVVELKENKQGRKCCNS